jgi:tripartite-type tricarboxylate transporter receptor subunit TctC
MGPSMARSKPAGGAFRAASWFAPAAIGLALLVLARDPSFAKDEFPSRPITFVIPFSAGGATDVGIRILAQKVSELTNSTPIIDNRGGGAGQLAATAVARAAPDGYTLLVAYVGTHALNKNLFKTLTYDPVSDFVPIISLWEYPSMLIVAADSPFKTVGDLIAAARANPGKLTFASQGNGTAGHLLGEMLNMTQTLRMIHVPYRGAANATTDLMGGRVDFSFSGGGPAIELVKEGKLRALGIADTRRSKLLPDVPTMTQAGAPGVELTVWFGLAAPARTPPEIVAKLHDVFLAASKDPGVERQFEGLGFTITASSQQEFAQRIASETERLGKIIRAAGIEPN